MGKILKEINLTGEWWLPESPTIKRSGVLKSVNNFFILLSIHWVFLSVGK